MLTQERLKELLDYDPETGVFIRLASRGNASKGAIAGSPDSKGYLRIFIEGKRYKAHRLAWLYVYGVWPAHQIDHINRTKSDNRIANLRETTNMQNCWNQGVRKNNKTRLLGVHLHKKTGKYRALIGVDNNTKHLGLYVTPEEAHAAYLAAKNEMHNLGEQA